MSDDCSAGRADDRLPNSAASAARLKLIHLLRGDLDWIVMKCLEKDRTRRYETANGLAMDIKRHLNNEPVVARPPSRLYRAPEERAAPQTGVYGGGGDGRRCLRAGNLRQHLAGD